MAGPRPRSPLALWSALQAAMYPADARNADFRRAFQDEAQESNGRVVRWAVLLAAPVNTFAIVVLVRNAPQDPAGAAWISWLVTFNAVLVVLGIVAGVVAWARRPAALWRALGDLMGVVWLLGAAARSANAQRANPNVTVFVAGAFFTVFFLRMRPRIFVPVFVLATSLVIFGIARFRQQDATRLADELTLLGTFSLVTIGFFVLRAARVRELAARRQVQLLNADLERRVEEQVREIVGRAREIEELNTQLNQKIRERSSELSQALARLAQGHHAIEPGTVLGGRAAIEAEIGRGGMGVVYRGRDLVTGKTVAIKVVQAGSASELDNLHRFLQEAQAMASVTHRAIVRSIHVDVSEDGRLFQMMELVEGEGLDACLGRCKSLPPPVAARLGAVLAGALAAAHAAGIVHRDIKPSNVMLTRAAPGMKLLDFGISRLWDEGTTSGLTADRVLGTPEFLSPEQVSAPASVGPPADVYALGLVLYLCVAGRMPFDPGGPHHWLKAHVTEAPADLSVHAPGVDPMVAGVVMACLHKAPEDRPTASAVADMLTIIADAAGTGPLEALDLARPAASTGPAVSDSAPTVLSPSQGSS